MLVELVNQHFSEQSPLKKRLASFAPREGQRELAVSIAQAILQKTHLVAEAGTGTGKTLAYLIPALLAEKKVIISTGTKALQDQLFYKDLPLVKETLGKPLKVALLKGRQNYLCQHYITTNTEQLTFASQQATHQLQQIRRQHQQTIFGEINEIENIPEDSEVWRAVTSTRENCLGQECAFYTECYVNKARKRALEADVVVVNHHVLLADYNLKEEGVGELLPNTEVIILDEAHQLPEIATRFYGKSLSSRQLTELASDIDIEYLLNAKDMAKLSELSHQLQKAVKDMRIALGEAGKREPWFIVANKPEMINSIQQVQQALANLEQPLIIARERSKGLEACWERYTALNNTFEQLTNAAENEHIHWYETFAQSFMIHHSPLSVAIDFQRTLAAFDAACIFTSATLTVNNHFTHYLEKLGLNGTEVLAVASPFQYSQQALLYVPRGIPDPKSSQYIEAIVQAAIPVIQLAKGRTFFLFTSYYALNQAALQLKTALDYPLFIQGTKPKDQLLKDFVESGCGVLLATASFWEGVDVRGDALSLVIIDKLPFATPDDPIHKARCDSLQKQGKQPFMHYSLPQAVIMLKQGVGRLIRDIDDTGVLMLCDPRLVGKDYAKIFLESLAQYPRTREFAKVQSFFEEKAKI